MRLKIGFVLFKYFSANVSVEKAVVYLACCLDQLVFLIVKFVVPS